MRIKGRSKYHAKRVHLDGYLFDSQAEAKRYAELRLLEKAGHIRNLVVHPTFPIAINGTKVCTVIADFSFVDLSDEKSFSTFGLTRVIDVKGLDLPISRLKRKLVAACCGIEIEVEKVKRG